MLRLSSILVRFVMLLLAAFPLLTALPVAAKENNYVNLVKHTDVADFANSALNGTLLNERDGRAEIRLDPAKLRRGTNPGGKPKQYWYGTLESAVLDVAQPFDTAIASWNGSTPKGTWLQVELRAYRTTDDHWTKYYNMGVWASGTETIARRSVTGQSDADGTVATDTLLLKGTARYTRYQYRVTLFTTKPQVSPSVRLLAVLTSDSARETAGLALESDREAWGRELNVPQRSQMIYKGGGEVWCSPTSTSMVLAYWGQRVPVPSAAAATYDHAYQGNGNWPFNTAWASTYGFDAYVTRMGSFAQVEEWISAGVPVIMSYAFKPGDLPGTPIRSSAGHIMVVRGFTPEGNVIANDPAAASDGGVRIVYDRTTLERLWLKHSGGTVYLIYPRGHAIPSSHTHGSW